MKSQITNRLARLEKRNSTVDQFKNWFYVRETELEAFEAWWPKNNPETPLSELTIILCGMPPKEDELEPPWGWGDTLKKWYNDQQ